MYFPSSMGRSAGAVDLFFKALRRPRVNSEIVCERTKGSPRDQAFIKVLGKGVPFGSGMTDALMEDAFMTEYLSMVILEIVS
ncbi:hypothetical protein CW700_01630 [Candidatus Bathyarchaeota archaeon]|nr:MAG: hypothetical protein CW700_01630 [Candidatus Bathyarchaeota archaeon]